MKRFKNYIFDLDGTLLDTLDDLTASTNYALHEFGMPVYSRDQIRMFVGNGVRKLIERAVPGGATNEQFEEVLSVFQQHYLQHGMDHTVPYADIVDLLTKLRAEGRRVAVVSNKFCAATKELCDSFFGELVEVAIGENEAAGIKKKPSPDTVVEAMRQLGATCNDTVYVGDSDVDIQTAKNSGIPCISVLWGFRDKDFLLAHGAETFVASPMDIIA